ncbi:MAG: dipeptide ABC transporter ATP-binding protein [Cyanobacteria bacterium P01_H01_bin.74]
MPSSSPDLSHVSQKPTDSSPQKQPLIEIKGLSKHFPIYKGFFNKQVGSVQAVNQVSLSIYPGETLGIVGESGCGKSTLGRCILQLIRPTSGSVTYAGSNLSQLSRKQLQPLRKSLQIVFQNPYASLNPRMRIGDALQEPLEVHRIGTREDRLKQVKALLAQVGLPEDSLLRYPHEFSGGQRQRIVIARALALNPQFIVADEPVSALDVSVQAQILNLLNDLKKTLGLTYFFIAHNLSVVQHISDRVGVMYLGEIVELAPADQLYKMPLHPYTQALLSAIPVIDPSKKKTERIILTGDLPSPSNPPSGCKFHTRCKYATISCKTTTQSLKEQSPGHWVACDEIEQIIDLKQP